MRIWITLLIALTISACDQEQPAPVAPIYDTAPVETRAIEVTVDAAGVVEPEVTVEIKSRASGEILAVHAETGDVVEAGALLVEVDQRTPRNRFAEAEAALVAARARRTIAETQMDRSRTLYGTGTLTETEYEQSQLEFANAEAAVIGMEVALENARIAMDDTEVRAPITGTIIQRQVEPGNVISSPTQDVSGGSILLQMADLTSVLVRTLVDETDIGKIQPGMATRVTVAAYPNQPFEGAVLKIEPQAIVEQNVTMFAVLIRLENRGDLLKPGMNAEVQIEIASRDAVASVPTMALRAEADIPTSSLMLGIPEPELREMLEASMPDDEGDAAQRPQQRTGRGSQLPDGVDMSQIQLIMAKRRNGETLTSEEQVVLSEMQARFQQSGGGMGTGGGGGRGTAGDRRDASVIDYQFGGSYWVVTLQDGETVPVSVRTGLTDLEYSEIVAGLDPSAEVLLLPSSSLFEQTETIQNFISQRLGSSTPFQATGGPGAGGGRGR
ncbi:MAG: efflux RND transporter periplasmic adaptor subunit [Candidatus Rariloculaceae bacterium]